MFHPHVPFQASWPGPNIMSASSPRKRPSMRGWDGNVVQLELGQDVHVLGNKVEVRVLEIVLNTFIPALANRAASPDSTRLCNHTPIGKNDGSEGNVFGQRAK